MKKLSNIKAILFDLDGTIYLGDSLIGNVKETLATIREKGIKIVFVSNNSSKTQLQYARKLKKLGIYDKRDIVYTSLDATIDYLKENYAKRTVYPICTKQVKKYLIKHGIKVRNKADIFLLTFDKDMTYKKIKNGADLINAGKMFIATHPDVTCPYEPYYIPDVGSFLQMFKASTGKMPDVIVGKPNEIMAKELCFNLSLKKEEIIMVGDRLYTDILFGVNNKMKSALVLSGETTLESYEKSGIKADLVLKDVNELVNYI